MKIIWWIVGLIMISYVRIWFVNNFATKKKYNKKVLIPICIFATIGVLMLYFYPNLLWVMNLWNLYFGENMTLGTIWMFVIYLVIFLGSIFVLQNKNFRNPIFRYIFSVSIFFVLLVLWWIFTGISFVVLYMIISVFAEELIKSSISKSIQTRVEKLDLIFVSLLVALAFSLVETLIFVISESGLWWWNIVGLVISRWVFTSLLHIVSTMIIAFFLQKSILWNKLSLWWILQAFGLGFLFHLTYNISIEYNITVLSIMLMVAGYFILSYFLFNSDSIFLELKTA